MPCCLLCGAGRIQHAVLCHAVSCGAVLHCTRCHRLTCHLLLCFIFGLIVPSPMQDWPENPELGLWVKRQRIARAAGQLRCEQAERCTAQDTALGCGLRVAIIAALSCCICCTCPSLDMHMPQPQRAADSPALLPVQSILCC